MYLIGDITSGNPNVFYEIGLAHAFGKPVIFLTQDKPEIAPIDVRQFEFVRYDLEHHEDFLNKLDNAIQNVFVGNYRSLYDEAIELLGRFNLGTNSSCPAASLEDFQARVMRGEQVKDIIPPESEKQRRAEFLLPKILWEAIDVKTMGKVRDWVSTPAP